MTISHADDVLDPGRSGERQVRYHCNIDIYMSGFSLKLPSNCTQNSDNENDKVLPAIKSSCS